MSDVGRGSISAGPAAAVGDTGSVLGIDISDCLGEEWKKRLPETNESNLEFRVADIYKTDLEVDQFDVIYVHQLLQHLSDPIGALRAATRLTKPGRLVSVREVGWGTFAAYPDLESLREFRRIYDEVATRNGGNSRTGQHVQEWMLTTGMLEDIQVSTSTWTFYEASGKAWWGDQLSHRILESDIAVKALKYGIATRSELEEVSAGW